MAIPTNFFEVSLLPRAKPQYLFSSSHKYFSILKFFKNLFRHFICCTTFWKCLYWHIVQTNIAECKASKVQKKFKLEDHFQNFRIMQLQVFLTILQNRISYVLLFKRYKAVCALCQNKGLMIVLVLLKLRKENGIS